MKSNTPLATLALLLVMAPFAAQAQTRVRPESLTGEKSTAGRVWVVLPSGVIAEADLVGIDLDLSGPRPALRATVPPPAPAPPATVEKNQTTKLAMDTPAITLQHTPLPDTFYLYRNGLLQAFGEDYTLSIDRRVITLLPCCVLKAGDIIQTRYRTEVLP
jgi:hypothetical protein